MGNNQSQETPLSNEEISECVKTSHFDEDEIKKLHKKFKIIAESQIRDGIINMGEFQQALGVESRGFAERLFNAFDKDKTMTLEFKEFVHSLSAMCPKANLDEKARFIFNVYDNNKSGDISRDELREILQYSLAENKSVHLSQQQIDQVIHNTFSKCDADGSGGVTLQEFLKAVNQNPSIVNCVSLNYEVLMSD